MRPGETPGSAIARSVDLARHAEELGFRRFWLAEHHSIEGLAYSATPVLIGRVDVAARRLFTTPKQRFLRLMRNQPVELLQPVDSMAGIWSDIERAAVESRLREAIVGSDSTVKAGLEKLVADTGADEVIAVTDTWEHEARLDSYRRVAEIAGSISEKQPAETAEASR